MVGTKDPTTDLWVVDLLNPTAKAPAHLDLHTMHNTQQVDELVNNVYSIKTKQNAVKYMHQCMCSPRPSTLLKAVQGHLLDGAQHLSERAINKYLPNAPATAKGHIKRPRKGLRRTTPKQLPTANINHPVDI